MRRLALVLPLLAACGSNYAPPNWPKSACQTEIFEGNSFIVCDPGKSELRLLAASPDETPRRSFAELMAMIPPERVAFAMNAGMFEEEGRPIGLAIVDGREVHAINRRKGGGNFHLLPNGIFLVRRDGRAEAVTSDGYKSSGDISLATQSGPMLVIEGKLHPKFETDGESRYLRNAVGVDRRGHARFVISGEAVSFGKLARLFRDRLGTPNALYFDGSVSSLWDPDAGRQDDVTPLGPIIVAMKPARSAPGRAGRATP